MADSGDLDSSAFLESVRVSGYCDVPIDIEGEIRSIRFTRPEETTLLLSAPAPPVYDADTQGPVDRLRHRLRRVLNVAGGPPVVVARILVMLFGESPSPILPKDCAYSSLPQS